MSKSTIQDRTTKCSVKRSFYQLLGVEANADQAQLDAGYAAAIARLNTPMLRGVKGTVIEIRLIRDGYQMLSDPARRAEYDAKLAELDAIDNAEVVIYESGSQHRKFGVNTVILVSVMAMLSGVIYSNLSSSMDEISAAQKLAYAKTMQ